MKLKLYLQMFAKSSTSSNTNSESTTRSESGSDSTTSQHSSTTGGSESTSVGHSETSSHGTTQTSSKGGAESQSSGKSWASGQVEANTQAKRNQYNTDYSEGEKVADTYQRLQDTISGKPTFQSQYEDRLNQLYESIMNRDPFSYDFNADNMYQMYKDQYTNAGKAAMQDSMGQTAALTGGYGSSYAQTVGQQTYQNYLQDLNNMIPTLRNQAYQEYQQEGQDLLNKYSLTNDAYNREYSQFRDDVSDWQSDRSFNYGMYSDERNFDYNQFSADRNYWNQEYWNERNAEQSNASISKESNWSNSNSVSDSYSTTDSRENTSTSSWSNTDSTSSTHTTGWDNSTTKSSSSTNSSTVSDATGSSTKTKTTGTTGSDRNDITPFNISKTDFVGAVSQETRDDMANTLINAASKSAMAYQNTLNDMIKEFNLSDAEVGYLENKVKNAGYAPSVKWDDGLTNKGGYGNW